MDYRKKYLKYKQKYMKVRDQNNFFQKSGRSDHSEDEIDIIVENIVKNIIEYYTFLTKVNFFIEFDSTCIRKKHTSDIIPLYSIKTYKSTETTDSIKMYFIPQTPDTQFSIEKINEPYGDECVEVKINSRCTEKSQRQIINKILQNNTYYILIPSLRGRKNWKYTFFIFLPSTLYYRYYWKEK